MSALEKPIPQTDLTVVTDEFEETLLDVLFEHYEKCVICNPEKPELCPD